MKKFIVFAAALSLALTAVPAFAKGKKAAPKKTWECKTGDTSVMTATVEQCMKRGGMVSNYPGPDKAAAPKAKKGKK